MPGLSLAKAKGKRLLAKPFQLNSLERSEFLRGVREGVDETESTRFRRTTGIERSSGTLRHEICETIRF
jgi:hypothetical protein